MFAAKVAKPQASSAPHGGSVWSPPSQAYQGNTLEEGRRVPNSPRPIQRSIASLPLHPPGDTSSARGPGSGLTVSPHDDPCERQAEEGAERMMRPGYDGSLTATAPTSASPPARHAVPSAVYSVLAGAGRSLHQTNRDFFEPHLGIKLDAVRIHDDAAAAASARAVNARAYAVGNNIVFGPAEYKPSTREGLGLLAHELLHVRQDRLSVNPAMQLRRSPLPTTPQAAVQLGETDLRQVARRLNVDPDQLLFANPQITNASALTLGQHVYLPQTQSVNPAAPAKQTASPTANKTPPPKPASAQENESLPAYLFSLAQAATQDLKSAHQFYLKTGKIPQTKTPWSWIEIKRGMLMTRAERYDAMVWSMEGWGDKIPQLGDILADNRDPEYLTGEEYYAEFTLREHTAWSACEDEYIRPGRVSDCQEKVYDKYGGEVFKEWRESGRRQTYANLLRFNQRAEALEGSGPVSLLGRVIGTAVGGEKWGDRLAVAGGLGDVGLAIGAGLNARGAGDYHEGGGEAPPESAWGAPLEPIRTPPADSANVASTPLRGSIPTPDPVGPAPIHVDPVADTTPAESVAGGITNAPGPTPAVRQVRWAVSVGTGGKAVMTPAGPPNKLPKFVPDPNDASDSTSGHEDTPGLRDMEDLKGPHKLRTAPSNEASQAAIAATRIPKLIYGDGTVLTRADFPDVVPDQAPGIGRTAPRALPLGRAVGASDLQNAEVQQDIEMFREAGGTDFRVNQRQTTGSRQTGTNRPDLSCTIDGRRVHIEYDRFPMSRAIDHARRILTNDPDAIVILKGVDYDSARP